MTGRPLLLRWDAAGHEDTSFDSASNAAQVPTTGGLNGLAVAPNGDLVASLVGMTFGAERYLATGALDGTFYQGGASLLPGGAETAQANAVAVRRDGSIVLGGAAFSTQGEELALAGLGPGGHLDTSFGESGSTTIFTPVGSSAVYSLAIDSVGRPVVAATFPTAALPGSSWSVARFTNIGALDESFGIITTKVGSCVSGGSATAVVVQPDGRILVAGPEFCYVCDKGTPGQDCDANGLVLARYWP
ncbi:MAG TPA: hypothetical protein VII82_00990 [Polyangiaceae bacterium]